MAWGLLRVGLGGDLALLPQLSKHSPSRGCVPPSGFPPVLLPVLVPGAHHPTSNLAAGLSSIKSLFALTETLTLHRASKHLERENGSGHRLKDIRGQRLQRREK